MASPSSIPSLTTSTNWISSGCIPLERPVFILEEKETRRPHGDAFKGAFSRALSKSEREISWEADRRRLLSQD